LKHRKNTNATKQKKYELQHKKKSNATFKHIHCNSEVKLLQQGRKRYCNKAEALLIKQCRGAAKTSKK
jgi:hypothetical protein